jgi:hypothetical protein
VCVAMGELYRIRYICQPQTVRESEKICSESGIRPKRGAKVVTPTKLTGVEQMSDKQPSPGQILTMAAVVGLVVFYSIGTSKGVETAEPAKTYDRLSAPDALTICQIAIKRALVYPESLDVPYVANFGRGDEFYFAWGASTRLIQHKNQMGLEVASSASCTVDARTGGVTSLTVNAKTIR